MSANALHTEDVEFLRDAVIWKHKLKEDDTAGIARVMRRLRATDKLELLWDYHDHLTRMNDD